MASVFFCEGEDGSDGWIRSPYHGEARCRKGYLGLMFQIDWRTYYGWVRLSVAVEYAKSEVIVTLSGYAYETTPTCPSTLARPQKQTNRQR